MLDRVVWRRTIDDKSIECGITAIATVDALALPVTYEAWTRIADWHGGT